VLLVVERPQVVRERPEGDAAAELARFLVGGPEVDAEQDPRVDHFLGRVRDTLVGPRVLADHH